MLVKVLNDSRYYGLVYEEIDRRHENLIMTLTLRFLPSITSAQDKLLLNIQMFYIAIELVLRDAINTFMVYFIL